MATQKLSDVLNPPLVPVHYVILLPPLYYKAIANQLHVTILAVPISEHVCNLKTNLKF